MQDKLSRLENAPAVTERRACPRFRVTSLMYIDMGDVNGGIVTSLSENGLALTAAGSLASVKLADGPLRMQIQFPGTPEAIEARGEIVWTSPSGKEACVRFVEIGEQARNQIRRWISDQAPGNGLSAAPPTLPKMRLPNSRRSKSRPSRLSFADVASSRVDGEGETEVENFSEITGAPGKLPPLEPGGIGFRDGKRVVASAFESPVFNENPTGEVQRPAHEQPPKPASGQNLQSEPSSSIPERRQRPRKQVILFTYAVLGEDNGGLVFNLGEGGLALTAAAALEEHHFTKMRVRFPDSADWFETGGRLAWKTDSGKEAGIEFLNLPEDARARIKEWMLQEDAPGNPGAKKNDVQTTQPSLQELPGFMEPEESSSEPFEIPASFQEQPFESPVFEQSHALEEQAERKKAPAASSALFKTGIRGILERASVKRRVARIKPPRLPAHSATPRTRAASKLLSIAAGVALAFGGWMFFRRTSLNEAGQIIAQNLPTTQPSHEPLQAPPVAKTEVVAKTAAADPPVQPGVDASKTVATQTAVSTPSLNQIEKSTTPNTSNTAVTIQDTSPERASKEKPRAKDALGHMPVESSPQHNSDQPQHPATPPQHRQETKSPQLLASAPALSSENKSLENKPVETKPLESKPTESKPVQAAQNFPAQNKELNATSPSPNPNPPQPAVAPPADLEKERLLLAPKQPEAILARTPVVAVSFDPFPSIRMPKEEKSKKSRQGKSLQMGRLLSRVDPVYPDEARQQGIEGTVKLHAIFNREGAVQSVISVSGPPLLTPAAMSAVKQWRYSQTILGGQAMETEEDVTVQFRLENSAAKN